MLSKKGLDSNSQHELDYDYLINLCRDLADELSDLQRYSSLIYSAWTCYDVTEKPSSDWYFTPEDHIQKIDLLLGMFCNRFTFKDIKELSNNVQEIHDLLKKHKPNFSEKKQ